MVNGLVHLDVWIHFYLVIPLMSSSLVRQRTPSTIYYYVTCLAEYVELFHTAPMPSRINFWTTCLVGFAFFHAVEQHRRQHSSSLLCNISWFFIFFTTPCAFVVLRPPFMCFLLDVLRALVFFFLASVDVSSFPIFQFIVTPTAWFSVFTIRLLDLGYVTVYLQ